MLEVGKKYYIIAHAYYHVVGEVVELTPRGVKLKNVAQVHSCRRRWTEFLKKGFADDTDYDIWPDGTIIPIVSLPAIPWDHEIPTKRKS